MTSGGAIKAGRAFVELFADDSKLVRTLKSQEQKWKQFGSTVAGIGGFFLGAGAAGAAAFLPTIKAASDLQETMNKFEVVFGDRADEVKEWGDEFAGQVGRSKKQIADFMASSQDLLVPMGIDPAVAEETSKQLTQLSIDLASFNNMEDSDTLRDLHAALTGSGEVMKKYGVIVSEAAVKQELLNSAIDPKKATEAEKAQARLNLIMAGTTAAQGDAIRSAGSYANQMKRLQGTWEDVKATIGSAILPIVTPLVEKFGDIVAKAGEWIAENQGLFSTLFKVSAAIAGVGAALAGIGAAIVVTGSAFGVIATAIAGIGTIAGVVFGLLATKAALAAAVVGGALFAAFKLVVDQSDAFQQISARWSKALGSIATAIKSGNIKAAWDVLIAGLKVEWVTFTDWLGGVVDSAWKGIVDNLPKEWANALQSIAKMLDALIAKLESLRQKAITGVADGIIYAYGKVTGMSDKEIEDIRAENRRMGDQAQTRLQNNKAFQSQLQNALNNFLEGPGDKPEGESDELKAARAALEAAQEAANRSGEMDDGDGPTKAETPEGDSENVVDAVAEAIKTARRVGRFDSFDAGGSSERNSAVGSFSGFRVSGSLSGGGPLGNIELHTRQTARNTKRLVDKGGSTWS